MDERVPVIQFAKGVKPGEGPQQTLTVRFVTEGGTEVLPTVAMSCPIGAETMITAPGLESGLKYGPMRVKALRPGYVDPQLSFMCGFAVVKLIVPNYPTEIEITYH